MFIDSDGCTLYIYALCRCLAQGLTKIISVLLASYRTVQLQMATKSATDDQVALVVSLIAAIGRVGVLCCAQHYEHHHTQVLQSMATAEEPDAAAGVHALLLEASLQLTEALLAQYTGLWPSQQEAANAAIATLLDAGVAMQTSAAVVRRVALAMLAAAAVPVPLAGWAGTWQ